MTRRAKELRREQSKFAEARDAWAVTTLCALLATAVTGCGSVGVSSGRASPDAEIPGSATLSWTAPTLNTDGTALTDLSGYTISFGTSSTELAQSITIDSPAATSYTFTGLAAGTWYFEIAANASDGTQSAPSATVSWVID